MCEHIQQVQSVQPNNERFNEEATLIQAPLKDEKEIRKDMIAQLRCLIKEQKEEMREDMQILKADRDFYWSKMDWISGVLDFYKGKDVESLKGIIKEILYLPYEKSVRVKRDGTIEVLEKMAWGDVLVIYLTLWNSIFSHKNSWDRDSISVSGGI